ncbi:glutathione S-transferase [Rhizobiales bacterium GAS113]|nr:glutathione S-transferase [Rhizobiales bacterium GAS113]
MPELVLYHASPSRSSIVLWMLEEVGEPYELHLLDLKRGDSRKPEYLSLNPMGKVPAIRHDGVVISEAAAICCYLADRFPQAGLGVPLDDARRGPYLKWLFFGPSCLEPALVDHMLKREGAAPSASGWGDLDTVTSVLRDAVSRTPFLMGERFTAADVVIGAGLRWGMMTKGVPEHPEFVAYAKRLEERPARQRANAKDAELAKQAGA